MQMIAKSLGCRPDLRYKFSIAASRQVSNVGLDSMIELMMDGADGQIGYSLLFRIASCSMFGPDQPVALRLIEIEPALPTLGGVVMELDDCAFPLVHSITPTSDLNEGFRGVNWALLVGSVPRKVGMERKDLLNINGRSSWARARRSPRTPLPMCVFSWWATTPPLSILTSPTPRSKARR